MGAAGQAAVAANYPDGATAGTLRVGAADQLLFGSFLLRVDDVKGRVAVCVTQDGDIVIMCA